MGIEVDLYLDNFLSSGLGASMSPFIGRLDGRSVGRSVCLSKKCQKPVKNCQKRGFEENIEKKSCSTTWVDPKRVFKPYQNPKISPLGPQKVKKTQKLSQIQKPELKE